MRVSVGLVMITASLLWSCESRERRAVIVQPTSSGAEGSQNSGSVAAPGGSTVSGTGAGTATGETASGSASPAAGGAATLSAQQQQEGNAFRGAWTGLQDEADPTGKWMIGASANAASPGANSGNIFNTPGAASTVDYSAVSAFLTTCVGACHLVGGSKADIPLNSYASAAQFAKRSLATIDGTGRVKMPPSGVVDAASLASFKAWVDGGCLERAGAAPNAACPVTNAGAAAPGANQPGANPFGTATGQAGAGAGAGVKILEIPEVATGNVINQTPVVAKVGDTLRIVNKRASRSFILHTNGNPVPHMGGNGVPPNGQVDIKLLTPYSGTQDVYEHMNDGTTGPRVQIQVTP